MAFQENFEALGGYPVLERIAAKVASDIDARDVAQESAWRMFKKSAKFDSTRASFSTWAYLNAKYVASHTRRGVGHRTASGSVPLEDVPESVAVSESAEDAYLSAEAETEKARAWRKVSSTVVHGNFTLQDVADAMRQGKQYADIAAELGMTEGAFKTAMSRAYAKAREA